MNCSSPVIWHQAISQLIALKINIIVIVQAAWLSRGILSRSPLNHGQWDALMSFAYKLGEAKLASSILLEQLSVPTNSSVGTA